MFHNPARPLSTKMKPIFTKLSGKYGDAIQFYIVDVSDLPVCLMLHRSQVGLCLMIDVIVFYIRALQQLLESEV